eukprot:gnl/Dysnectes_brevis/308_a342_3554.p1 GENE.gnl/Dysnectes_brevis/308_a342_3554~~gnl/Dysnectes_brevis/308_a342_3554.p1  ORF type:complete len:438 (+),score=134.77 gnl/Dysnectes_brevis/308_a342_3554:97-1410(+)
MLTIVGKIQGQAIARACSRFFSSAVQKEATSVIAKKPIYLDYQATTPMDPRVLDAMMPYFTSEFGNAHSRHLMGDIAFDATEVARQQVADLINANSKEIIFTSGATESNNLAIKGAAHFYGDKKPHIITTVVEHKCVLESCRSLEAEGFEVTYLPVDPTGMVYVEELEAILKERGHETALVSILAVNNEVGTLQPLKQIGTACRAAKVPFHTDAAQAFGKVPIDVRDMGISLMSVSGHKIYGPKGVGALFVSRKPRVRLVPLLSGGGQERGLRSGTLPVPLVVGLGEAARIAGTDMGKDDAHARHLFDVAMSRLGAMEEVSLNGHPDSRWHGNLNLSFFGVEGESLMMATDNICVSSGSACTSASLEPSHVLHALGLDADLSHTAIRMGWGRFTTEEEVREAADDIAREVVRLRELSPLWQMKQEGVDIHSIEWGEH